MNKSKSTVAAFVCLTIAGLALFLTEVQAQKTKGKTRAALTKQLMKGIMNANCGDLAKLLKESDVKWDDVALKAAILNEGGYLLMDDGRCPDGDWAGAAKAIQGASAEILVAADAKNLDAANAGFKKLTADGCSTCHKAHRPK